ncbi:hypothetical protein EV368DRAFT_84824 [Lentinula lateritia]|nr:hypothetical protein EV368DRAFT_84824 [Lentinula lateritia]
MAELPPVNPAYYHVRNQENDPPPAYTPPRSNGTQPVVPVLLTFDVPLNSNVIGAAQTLDSLQIPSTSSFNDAYTQICECMGVSEPPSFATSHITTSKRKRGSESTSMGQEPSIPPKGFKDEAAMLREHLKCAIHHQYCFVMQDTQSIRAWHEKILDYEIDLWAKLWVSAVLSQLQLKFQLSFFAFGRPRHVLTARIFLLSKSRLKTLSFKDSSTNQNDHEPIPDNLGILAVPDVHIHNHYPAPVPISPDTTSAQCPTTSSSVPTGRRLSNPLLLTDKGGQRLSNHGSLQDFDDQRSTAPSTSFITAVPKKDSASGFDEALFCQPATPLDQAFSGISGTSALDTQLIDHLLQNVKSNNDSVVVTYPSVMTVLNLMDRQCGSSSSHRMASYYRPLMEYGFGYMHNVTLLAYDYAFFVDSIGMPRDHVQDFIEICHSITLHAKQSQM